jgi:hypothetical protein
MATFKTKAERSSETVDKKAKKEPFSEQISNPQTFEQVMAMKAEGKPFLVALKACITDFNASSDNSEYVVECKKDGHKFRVEVDLAEPEETDKKDDKVAKKGGATKKTAAERNKLERVRMWSPSADKLLKLSPSEFIEKEKSDPESMQALFDKMELSKTRMFVLKNTHNTVYDNYELKVVFIE